MQTGPSLLNKMLIITDNHWKSQWALAGFLNTYDLNSWKVEKISVQSYRTLSQASYDNKAVLFFCQDDPDFFNQVPASFKGGFVCNRSDRFQYGIDESGKFICSQNIFVEDQKQLPRKMLYPLQWLGEIPIKGWQHIKSMFDGQKLVARYIPQTSSFTGYLIEECPDLFDKKSILQFWTEDYGEVFIHPSITSSYDMTKDVRPIDFHDPNGLLDGAFYVFQAQDQSTIEFKTVMERAGLFGFIDVPYSLPYWGLETAVHNLFQDGETVDFVGIGRFFSIVSGTLSFRPDMIGQLVDNDPLKKELCVFGKKIKPFADVKSKEVSSKVCISVIYPESLLPSVRKWVGSSSKKIYFLKPQKYGRVELCNL